MKKTAFLLVSAAAIIAAPAQARDGQVYAGINGGIVFEDQADVESEPFRGTPPENEARINTGTGWEAGAVLGYDFGMFRLEGEGNFRNQDHDTLIITSSNNTSGLVAGNRFGPGSTQKTYSGMLNALVDIGDDDGFQVFAGGGAGIAIVDFELSTPETGMLADDTDTTFAYQGLAGVRYAVTENIDLGVKYRYFRADNVNVDGFGGSPLEIALESHSVLASLLFNFGGSEAAPPPQAQCNTGPYIVFFEFDESEVTAEAATILNNAITAYANCGSARVMLAGHTDTVGSQSYNMDLAARRNQSVRNYMTGRGVPDGRIASEAFGESQPRVPTADGVREPQNRRVEVTYGPGSGM
ncbi:OmpA family protein [Erythrobacter sp.]|uniref:OmpA family protein n=1 Tax=Erythrobacter sp. TaxID=1042 RepID=UPI0025D6E6F7|nr:OmpA family protein [Erythrobacter sp.]